MTYEIVKVYSATDSVVVGERKEREDAEALQETLLNTPSRNFDVEILTVIG